MRGNTLWPEELAKTYRKHGYWKDKTLFQQFYETSQKFPNRLAIKDPIEVTYNGLLSQIFTVTERLKSHSLKPRDTVVLQLGNDHKFVTYLLGCLALGLIPVMGLPAHRGRELNHLLNTSKAKAFITEIHPNGDIGGFNHSSSIDWQGTIINANDETLLHSKASLAQTSQLDQKNIQLKIEDFCADNITADSIALLQLSGGTTGLPKLIPRTHNDYLYSILESNKICNVSCNSTFLCILPAAHNFTLSSPGILGMLFAGGSLILRNRIDASEAFSLIQQQKVSHCALVPPIALNWLNYQKLSGRNDKPLSNMSSLLVGGAKLNPSSAEALIDTLGAPLQQVFGMAEGLVNYTRLTDSRDTIIKTQGKPISQHDIIRIVDDEDRLVPAGCAGHLLTRGPYTICAYYSADNYNKKAFTDDGFYRTGDIVSVDTHGYLTVEGRHKDQINRGGEKVAPTEIENYLLKHQDIADVAVIGINDDYLGERTAACIVAKNHELITLSECRKFLKQLDIAEYKLPDKIYCLTELPKTPFGKISKNQLRLSISQQDTL